jgi:hypothetical protein
MKTVAIEDLMLDVIISFCENAAELGCPQKKKLTCGLGKWTQSKLKK